MTIVLLRGTSGSGKTFIAEHVMQAAGLQFNKVPLGPRGKTGAYTWDKPPLALMGRYETACGGCDGLSWPGAADDIEAEVQYQASTGRAVLLEGLMVATWGVQRLLRLKRSGLTVIHLITPLEKCLESVNERRRARFAAKGAEFTPVNPKNTTAKFNTLQKTSANNRKAGITVEDHSRTSALPRTLELLGLVIPHTMSIDAATGEDV